MENRGLLFIPDISGFTRFVNETEIDHSRIIIQELLEVLINANQIGLEVSEIEGDAILFYKFGDSPDLNKLYKQVEQMFCTFHKHLIAYEHTRFCQCTACSSAINLTLKVITHYGEFASYNVKNFKKLIGKDIIVAHQLLKNDIDQHEYWLVTKNLVADNHPASLEEWMKWDSSTKQTENGNIAFHYTQLGQLKNRITLEPPQLSNLAKMTKAMSFTEEFTTDIITLFHGVGDFRLRSRWMEGVKEVKEVSHFLPRIGTKCRCYLTNGESVIYFVSSYLYRPEKIEFSETEENDEICRHFIMEKIDVLRTRLTIEVYIKKGLLSKIAFRMFKQKNIEDSFKKSILNLHPLVKEIQLPVEV
jgi:hypothetical protein